jgi:sortase (surface protein transpeptidase)
VSAFLQRHVWVIGTGATAALVFLVTFVAVSAATGDDVPSADTVIRPGVPGIRDNAVVTDFTEDQAEEAPAESAEAESDATRTETSTRPRPSDRTVSDEPPPLPEFDETDLIHGGTGSQGRTLAGRGIVESSRSEAETDWELLVPSARLKAAIVKVGTTPEGALGAPDNPEVIGWWEEGPLPGRPGNVLLDGHRDFSDIYDQVGTGVCWALPQTQPGDPILIRDNAANVYYLYEVTETASVGWDDSEGTSYLAPAQEAKLTLVTCEGSFDEDSHNYSNRRIVVSAYVGLIPFESITESE